MRRWAVKLRALVPGSIAARGWVLIGLVAGPVAASGALLHWESVRLDRQRRERAMVALLAAAMRVEQDEASPADDPDAGWVREIVRQVGDLCWVGVVDQAGGRLELLRQGLMPPVDVFSQIDPAAWQFRSAPLEVNGRPSARFELLAVPQLERGRMLAAVVDRTGSGEAASVPGWPLWVAAAGLALARLWLHVGIERPITRLGHCWASVHAGLMGAAVDGLSPSELQALVGSVEQLQEELRSWRLEAVQLRNTVETEVEARTRQAALARRRAEREALTDPLTGLYNRRALERQIPELLERVQSAGQDLCLIMLDVDHFKAFNDRHGHPAGDRLLAFVGTLLRATLRRGTDQAFRYGGDEFLAVLPDTTACQAHDVARRLVSLFMQWARTLEHQGRPDLMPGLSAGVAALREHRAGSWEKLLQLADQALYWAKRHGCRAATAGEVCAGGGPGLT